MCRWFWRITSSLDLALVNSPEKSDDIDENYLLVRVEKSEVDQSDDGPNLPGCLHHSPQLESHIVTRLLHIIGAQ